MQSSFHTKGCHQVLGMLHSIFLSNWLKGKFGHLEECDLLECLRQSEIKNQETAAIPGVEVPDTDSVLVPLRCLHELDIECLSHRTDFRYELVWERRVDPLWVCMHDAIEGLFGLHISQVLKHLSSLLPLTWLDEVLWLSFIFRLGFKVNFDSVDHGQPVLTEILPV